MPAPTTRRSPRRHLGDALPNAEQLYERVSRANPPLRETDTERITNDARTANSIQDGRDRERARRARARERYWSEVATEAPIPDDLGEEETDSREDVLEDVAVNTSSPSPERVVDASGNSRELIESLAAGGARMAHGRAERARWRREFHDQARAVLDDPSLDVQDPSDPVVDVRSVDVPGTAGPSARRPEHVGMPDYTRGNASHLAQQRARARAARERLASMDTSPEPASSMMGMTGSRAQAADVAMGVVAPEAVGMVRAGLQARKTVGELRAVREAWCDAEVETPRRDDGPELG